MIQAIFSILKIIKGKGKAKYDFDKVYYRFNENYSKYQFLQSGEIVQDPIPIVLTIADMDFKCAKEITKALKAKTSQGIFGYPQATNKSVFLAYQKWLKTQYGYDISQEDVCYSMGGVNAFSIMYQILTKENDGIIILAPNYHMFMHQAEILKRRPVQCLLQRNGTKFDIDFQNLEILMKDPSNRIVVFSNPANPTGRVFSSEELRQLGDLCIKYDKSIISDEIFADLAFKKHTIMGSISKEIEDRTLTIFSSSKAFNTSGLFSTLIIIKNKKIMDEYKALMMKNGMFILNSFGQIAIQVAYEKGLQWLTEVKQYIQQNYIILKAALDKLEGVELFSLEAGYLVLVSYEKSPITKEQFIEQSKKLNLYMSDMDNFYFPITKVKEFRMSIACPKSILQEACSRLTTIFTSQHSTKI
eukprot:TRINITY_DN1279_c0_g1_i1.p1 TRINITY_DN1279_c0_g1~~TRINITY_DN1279_c0_g1_i1.p1  ORF type:complete len:415 (-),score=81.83 TRINITY_DN1279_c0_g1_i1:164-1408(-)